MRLCSKFKCYTNIWPRNSRIYSCFLQKVQHLWHYISYFTLIKSYEPKIKVYLYLLKSDSIKSIYHSKSIAFQNQEQLFDISHLVAQILLETTFPPKTKSSGPPLLLSNYRRSPHIEAL